VTDHHTTGSFWGEIRKALNEAVQFWRRNDGTPREDWPVGPDPKDITLRCLVGLLSLVQIGLILWIMLWS